MVIPEEPSRPRDSMRAATTIGDGWRVDVRGSPDLVARENTAAGDPLRGAWLEECKPARCRRHANLTLAAIAVIATVVSAYPIIFLGRSFVSPDVAGTALLYQVPHRSRRDMTRRVNIRAREASTSAR